MSEFLAPLDYRRARDTLRSLDFYTAYTPEGAERVQGLLRERYPLVFARTEQKMFVNGAFVLEVEVPVNTEATVYLPVKPDAKNVTADVAPVTSDRDRMAFRVGSGRYRFCTR